MPLPADYFPRLEVGSYVDPANAMLDRVELTMRGWHLICRSDETAEILSGMSHAIVPGADGHANLFQTRTFNPRWAQHQLVVAGSGRGEAPTYPYPTFSGVVNAKAGERSRFIQLNSGSLDLTAMLQLNVSRSLMAQRIAKPFRGSRPSQLGSFLLAISPQPDWQTEERVFVNTDNVIIGTDRRANFAFARPPECHLAENIRAVWRAIGEAFEEAGGHWHQITHPAVTLDQIEVYWEFAARSPLFTLGQLRLHLPRAAERLGVSRRYLDQIKHEKHGPSECIGLTLRQGVYLRVYAKSDWRIRFEVCFSGPALGKPKPQNMPVERVQGYVATLRGRAAEVMNDVLLTLWSLSDLSGEQATTEDLERAFSARFPDPQRAAALLVELCHWGHIRPKLRDDLVRPGLELLVDDDVLVRDRNSPGGRSFVVTPRYELARRLLSTRPTRPPVKPRPGHLLRRVSTGA